MQTIGSKISSSKFDWNSKTREFCAEISMLQHGGIDPLGRLYPDSADQGFTMISQRTGNEVSFHLVNTSIDGEGEVRFWVFLPVPTIYSSNMNNVRVIILND